MSDKEDREIKSSFVKMLNSAAGSFGVDGVAGLARKLGRPKTTVWSWASGDRFPQSTEDVEKIAAIAAEEDPESVKKYIQAVLKRLDRLTKILETTRAGGEDVKRG